MTIKHLYPSAWPKVDFNFAATRQLDPRITFTRDSIGTYIDAQRILRYAAEGEPRFDHDPATGESLGLLIEESRTNRMVNSTLFTNYNLKSTDVQIVAASGTAPDSTNTATLIHPSGSGTQSGIGLSGIGTNAGSATTSIFAKANGKNWLALYDAYSTSAAYFDLANGVKGSKDSGVDDYWIESVGNGWYKCSVYSSSSSNYIFGVNACDDNDSLNCAPNGTDGVLIWGSQLEVGNFPSSYIPTSGSTETRSADLASISGTNLTSWYNQDAGTIFSLADRIGATGATQLVWHFRDGGRKEHNASGDFQFYDLGGYTSGNLYTSPYTPNVQYKGIYAFETNSAVSALSGVVAIDSESTVYTPTVHDHLSLGSNYLVNNFLCGHIARFAYYPRRLTNEQLEALTS